MEKEPGSLFGKEPKRDGIQEKQKNIEFLEGIISKLDLQKTDLEGLNLTEEERNVIKGAHSVSRSSIQGEDGENNGAYYLSSETKSGAPMKAIVEPHTGGESNPTDCFAAIIISAVWGKDGGVGYVGNNDFSKSELETNLKNTKDR